MKIGFSLGGCLNDILHGRVDLSDVAFIIASTNVRDSDGLERVIKFYSQPNEVLCDHNSDDSLALALQLWEANRIIQPRAQGIHCHPRPNNGNWVDIFPTANSNNHAVRSAWDNYQTTLNLVETVDTGALVNFKL